jgi:uncharacterized protein (TIGR03435 family)
VQAQTCPLCFALIQTVEDFLQESSGWRGLVLRGRDSSIGCTTRPAAASSEVSVRILWNSVTIFMLAQAGAAAQPSAPPGFDVASVKALPTELRGGDFQVTPTSVSFHNYPLGFMIRWAYGLHPYQAFETVGPTWLEPGLGCVRFDVVGKVDHPVPVEQLRLMLRPLLADRLKLSLHRGTKEMTVAAISVGKDGPKLHPSEEADMSFSADGDVMHFKGALISRLYEWLYQFVPYLMVDETGLRGATTLT